MLVEDFGIKPNAASYVCTLILIIESFGKILYKIICNNNNSTSICVDTYSYLLCRMVFSQFTALVGKVKKKYFDCLLKFLELVLLHV